MTSGPMSPAGRAAEAGVCSDVARRSPRSARVVGIHQPQYIPYPGFFHKLAACDVMVLLDNVQFQKAGFQNRNRIRAVEGSQWLTIPVRHRSSQLIRDVRIDTRVPWQKKHWSAVRSNYARSPFLEQTGRSFGDVLRRDWDLLWEVDVALIRWAMDVLRIDAELVLASELGVSGQRTELLIDICEHVGGTCYLSGPGGRAYLTLDAFASAGIEVVWQQYQTPRYRQLRGDGEFLPDLSIVDTVLCCGAQATAAMIRQAE